MIVSTRDGSAVMRAKVEKARRQRSVVEVEADEPLDLYGFVRAAWHVLEPDVEFVDGWHIGAIAEHLAAVTDGEVRRLIINVPPGSMKSLLTCVFWPAWEWGENRPATRWLFGSYAEPLALRDSMRMRRLIRSAWYQGRYGGRFQILRGQDTQKRYDNSRGGYRIATSVGGTGTGERADRVVVDDPQKKTEIHTTKRGKANDWIKTELRTRGTSPDKLAIVLIQQRLHEDDATGFVLDEMEGFEHLSIPARFEPERRFTTSIGWTDPRDRDREIYWQMYDDENLTELEGDLGSSDAAGQLQQRPYPAGGQIIQETWWNFWQPNDIDPLPPVLLRDKEGNPIEKVARPIDLRQVTTQAQSWDLAFKDTKASAFVAGQTWGVHAEQPANRYLLDQERRKADIIETILMIRRMTNKWPGAVRKWIEDKANGPAVIRTLRDKISGIKPITPRDSKVGRATAVVPEIEAGNVYLPHPSISPWVLEFIAEAKAFPSGRYADQVDAATQALLELRDEGGGGAIDEGALLDGLTA